jgi:hypothetical protein
MEALTEWPKEFNDTETRGEPLFTITFNRNRIPRDILTRIFGYIPRQLEEHIEKSVETTYTLSSYCYPCTYPPNPIGGGYVICLGGLGGCFPCSPGSC